MSRFIKTYRASWLPLMATLLWAGSIVSGAEAQTDIYVRGSGRLIPVALPQLCLESGTTEAATKIPAVMARDLDLSGYFQVIDPGSYIETPGRCPGPDGFSYSDWSVIGADGLVRGTVQVVGELIRVRMYLYDVPRRQMVLGKEYEGDATQISRMGHRFANEVMKFFTGQYGPFGSQIVYSSRVGRFKELFIMDMDGSNMQRLTNERGLALSPSWDSSGANVVYTSYRSRMPDLFLLDVMRRSTRQISRGEGLEIGAKFLGNGTFLTSRSSGRDSDIVIMGRDGNVIRKMSAPPGTINVSPSLAPDGQRFAFCSNRAGGPQIYVSDLSGGPAQRISFVNANYCTSPAWSPKADRIAFVCRSDGGFQIYAVDANGSNALQLTSGGDNEDPDWSPDGRYLAFATTFGKRGGPFHIAMMREDGSNVKQLSDGRSGDFEPSWGPVVP